MPPRKSKANDPSKIINFYDIIPSKYKDEVENPNFDKHNIKTPFRKHDKQYIPLCVGFYDNFKNTLSYYSELYRLDKVLKKDFPFYRSIYISKKENDNAFGNLVKIDTVLDDQDPYVSGTFDIDNLPSGNYYLNISLGNIFHQTIASQSVFFQRFNTHQKKEVLAARKAAVDTAMDNVTFLNLNKTFVIKYTLPQLRSILKMLLPLTDPVSTRSIDAFLKKPDEMYMRYFIYNFFLGVNRNNPGAAWDEYAEKVKEANKLYTVHGRPGYETARGFMFLRYGAPSEVVTESNERGSLPYEIWQYNTLKEMNGKEVTNAVILFYKGNESDFDYKLLHTTIDGETHNAGWRSFLYNQSDGGTGFNSRAEQYIGNR